MTSHPPPTLIFFLMRLKTTILHYISQVCVSAGYLYLSGQDSSYLGFYMSLYSAGSLMRAAGVTGPRAIICQVIPGLPAWWQQVPKRELGSVHASQGHGSESTHFHCWSKQIARPAEYKGK